MRAVQVFQAMVRLLHMLAHAKTAKPSSGLELLLEQQRRWQQAQAAVQHALQQSPGPPAPPGSGPAGLGLAPQQQQQPTAPQQAQQQQQQLAPQGPPGERAKVECSAAWDVVQSECERLLGAVLEVQQAASPMASSSSQGDMPGGGGPRRCFGG